MRVLIVEDERDMTGVLKEDLEEENRYFLAVPRHDKREAEVRVYETSP
jgi:DNA-binding response OmpR family regulator